MGLYNLPAPIDELQAASSTAGHGARQQKLDENKEFAHESIGRQGEKSCELTAVLPNGSTMMGEHG